MCHLVVPAGSSPASSELTIASPIPSAELPGAQGRVCSQPLRLKLPICVVFSPLLCPKLCCCSLLLPKSLPPLRILRMNLLALGLAFQARRARRGVTRWSQQTLQLPHQRLCNWDLPTMFSHSDSLGGSKLQAWAPELLGAEGNLAGAKGN